MALCTTSDNNVIQNSFSKKHLFYKLFFLSSCVCTPIDESYQTNQIFLRKQISVKICLLENIFFLFYHSSSVLPLIKTSFKHNTWKITFIKSNFSELKSFFEQSCVNPFVIFTEFFKKNLHETIFLWRKKYTLKNVFPYITLLLCTPTDNNVNQNIFLKKHSSKNIKF